MIIYRYLSRQLFASTLGVATVLVMILVIGRFVRVMAQAAAGRISGEVVVMTVLYRLPVFLELILPLALFLGILLAYGRLYLDNEMTVLESSGMSPGRLVRYTLVPALCMSLLVGFFSLYLGPWGVANSVKLMEEEKNRSGLEVLSPGRFFSSKDGRTVTFTESASRTGKRMEQLFIVTFDRQNPDLAALITADAGQYRIDKETGARYLVLEQGYRFQGSPGHADFNWAKYQRYDIKIEEADPYDPNTEYEHRTTLNLLNDPAPEARAELHWRLAVPLLVPIVAFLAVPLSRVNPRQGRYLKLLPSIVLYLAYLSLLLAGKDAIANGELDPALGLFWIHGLFLGLALLIHFWPAISRRFNRSREAKREPLAT